MNWRPFKYYATRVKFLEKRYEGVRFNGTSVTRGWVGVKYPGKKGNVTVEWPMDKQLDPMQSVLLTCLDRLPFSRERRDDSVTVGRQDGAGQQTVEGTQVVVQCASRSVVQLVVTTLWCGDDDGSLKGGLEGEGSGSREVGARDERASQLSHVAHHPHKLTASEIKTT